MNREPAGWRIKSEGGKILFVVCFGAWNSGTAVSFRDEAMAVTAAMGTESWAFLWDASDWIVDDGGVQAVVGEFNRWVVRHGCRSGFFYTGAGINRLLLYRLVEPDTPSFRFRVFPDRARCVGELADDGYSLTPKQLDSFFRGEGKRI